jgi:hypothetical protein
MKDRINQNTLPRTLAIDRGPRLLNSCSNSTHTLADAILPYRVQSASAM